MKNKKTRALTLGLIQKICPRSKRSTPVHTRDYFDHLVSGKRSQEEMVGFVLIIIIVSVILLFFLSFSLRSSKMEIESYEVEGFIQSFLQYTTDCEDSTGFLSVQNLIFSCGDDEMCLDGRSACETMEITLKEICENSWNVGEDTPIKGYALRISLEGEELLLVNKGNITQNYKGAAQDFTRSNEDYEISFNVYY